MNPSEKIDDYIARHQ